MIDLTQPPNIINREILKLPLSEQEYWINKWQAQIPPEINTSIPKYKPVSPTQDWHDEPASINDALSRTESRRGKFGRKEKQEYAKNKSESEMKEFLQDQVKVKQTSKAFRNKVKTDLERLGIVKCFANSA